MVSLVMLSSVMRKFRQKSEKLFKGRHYEALIILQAVLWYLRYPLSYRNIEEMFKERGFEVDHATINRWVLFYAPLLEKAVRHFKKPHCGSVRIDETYVRIRGKWSYLYRAIDKYGTPIDFMLSAKRDLDAAKRFFRKCFKNEGLFAPDRIGTDGDKSLIGAVNEGMNTQLFPANTKHYITKYLQQRIESDQFRVKIPMPRIGGFQTFQTARKTIQGIEAALWLKKGMGTSKWSIHKQNEVVHLCLGLKMG